MVYKNKGKFELKESVLQSIVKDILSQRKNKDVVILDEPEIHLQHLLH